MTATESDLDRLVGEAHAHLGCHGWPEFNPTRCGDLRHVTIAALAAVARRAALEEAAARVERDGPPGGIRCIIAAELREMGRKKP